MATRTKEEQDYIDKVLSLGCIVTGKAAAPHHVKCFNNGWGKVSDFLVIPLCPELHNQGDDSIHLNKSVFEMKHGREVDLLAETIKRVTAL